MWSHHIRCPSKAKHKFFAWSTSYAMFWILCQPKIQYMSVVCRICWGAFWRLEWWDDERCYFVTAGRLFAQHVPTSSTYSCNGVKNFIKIQTNSNSRHITPTETLMPLMAKICKNAKWPQSSVCTCSDCCIQGDNITGPIMFFEAMKQNLCSLPLTAWVLCWQTPSP